MRQLGMIGTTFRRTGQEALRRYMLADAADSAAAVRAMHEKCGFLESVYLATCNRVEIIFLAPPGVSVAECRRRLYRFFHPNASVDTLQSAAAAFHAYEGEGAAEHLFSVAASLDSMNPGEAQILGQVKSAYKEAQALGLCGTQLALVFEEAFAAAKKVRHTTKLGAGSVSMVSLAVGVVNAHLQAAPKDACLAVVGVGDMAHQCGQIFGKHGGAALLFVNRTLPKAEALASAYGGTAMALDEFLRNPPPVDVIVSATAAPEPFLNQDFFARVARSLLVIDLAVQRDADPQSAARAQVMLYDLDRLNDIAARNRREREVELAHARVMVDEALEAFRRRLAEREMAPVLREVRDSFASTMDKELGDLFDRVLISSDAATQEQVRRWATAVVNRLAHVPTVGLKQLAFEHGMESVETFLAGLKAAHRRRP